MPEWAPASRVRGLFGDQAQMASTPAAAMGASTATAASVRAQPVAAQPIHAAGATPIAYASGVTIASGSPIGLKRRNPIAFTVIAVLMFISGILVTGMSWFGSPSGDNVIVALGGTCSFLLLCIPAVVLWLVWVYGVHADVRSLSNAGYSISPGQAVGFSFIPLFDAFWGCYMPYRLSGQINQYLQARQLAPINSSAVLACQIASVVSALLVPGVLPVLYAVTMWQVQGGLNRLIGKPRPGRA